MQKKEVLVSKSMLRIGGQVTLAAVGERVVGKESSRGNMLGQGSRESKGADEVEVMTKPRKSLFSSSIQGGGDGAVGIAQWYHC